MTNRLKNVKLLSVVSIFLLVGCSCSDQRDVNAIVYGSVRDGLYDGVMVSSEGDSSLPLFLNVFNKSPNILYNTNYISSSVLRKSSKAVFYGFVNDIWNCPRKSGAIKDGLFIAIKGYRFQKLIMTNKSDLHNNTFMNIYTNLIQEYGDISSFPPSLPVKPPPEVTLIDGR